jgi:hypothetical protein
MMREDKGIVTTESDRKSGHYRHIGLTKDIDIGAPPAVCRLPKWDLGAGQLWASVVAR